MRSPVDELYRKKKSQCSVECSFSRNPVISQCISKVDTSTCRSRPRFPFQRRIGSRSTRITLGVVSFETNIL